MANANVRAKLQRLQEYIASKRGVSLRLLYSVNGTEKTGTVANMEADRGEFIRVLGGNSLDDLDRMLRFELANIRVVEG